MNKLLAMLLTMGLITAVLGFAIIFRPAYMKFTSVFNSTIYNQNVSEATTQWNRTQSTTDYLYWVIPGIAVLMFLGWLYMTMQEKEYVGAGYY